MRYELLGGMHEEGGKVYNRGDVFDSKHDLAEIFPNKFKQVPGVVEAVPAPPIPVAKKKSPVKTKPEAKKDVVPEKDAGDDLAPAPEAPAPEGEDVTESFSDAEEAGMLVFKITPRRFNVIDPQDGGAVVNDSPLPLKGIEELLKTYLGD